MPVHVWHKCGRFRLINQSHSLSSVIHLVGLWHSASHGKSPCQQLLSSALFLLVPCPFMTDLQDACPCLLETICDKQLHTSNNANAQTCTQAVPTARQRVTNAQTSNTPWFDQGGDTYRYLRHLPVLGQMLAHAQAIQFESTAGQTNQNSSTCAFFTMC